uniref:HTH La-type RNA-binding domain-containing protein n=1 Tax=Aquila chrysaetos chrysaetos TaxID=223781 RepID=A0A663EJN3_AQUCH
MRGLPVFRPTPKSLPSSSWGGKGLREGGVPPGPTGSYEGLWVQILFALNTIFQVGEKEQVDSAKPSGDQAAAAASLCQMSHPCPCCFARSFCDASDVLGADLLDCSYSIPDPQLVRRIVSQVEFYLSDENLAKDTFLLKHVQKNKMGFVSIKLLTSLKKVGSGTIPRASSAAMKNRVSSTSFLVSWVPIPESLLSIPPSKLLLAWELLPPEQDVLLPLQNNFLKTITRMFSPFSTITSIRILRLGHKLPLDMRKYTSDFPELLSKCCALVEYESLESARSNFEDVGHQSCLDGESIRVVRLCGKGSKKTPGAEREVAEELVDQPGWKAQAVAATFPDDLGDSLLCSSPELNGERVWQGASEHGLLCPTTPGRLALPREAEESQKVIPALSRGGAKVSVATSTWASPASSSPRVRARGWDQARLQAPPSSPASCRMAWRCPSHPRRAWEEEAGAVPAPSSGPQPNKVCEVQPQLAGE